MPNWMVRNLGGQPQGPYSTEQIIAAVDEGDLGVEIEVTPDGESKWLPIEMVPEFADLAFFDGETNVVDSPWFAEMAKRGGLAPPRTVSDTQMEAVQFAEATPRAQEATSQDTTAAPRATSSSQAAGTRPAQTLMSATHGPPQSAPGETLRAGTTPYADEDIATKVVASPVEMARAADAALLAQPAVQPAGQRSVAAGAEAPPPQADAAGGHFEVAPPSGPQSMELFDDFEETMTRVAPRNEPDTREPRPPPPSGGVLPTLTMERDFFQLRANQAAGGAPPQQQGFPAPPLGTDPQRNSAPPLGSGVPHAPALAQPYAPSPYNAQPSGAPLPPGAQPYDPAHMGYPQTEPEEAPNDTGIKALIFLIVVLAMALTVVLVLLLSQQ